MLILTRKKSEIIVIDVNGVKVEVMLVQPKRDKARIGVKAPSFVTVNRKEVQDEIDKEVAHA